MEPLLHLDHISLSYHSMDGEIPALSNISFTLYRGEFLAIVGPSGCGKSTLLNLLCGLLSPEDGTLCYDTGYPSGQKPVIGYMLQKDHLLPWRNIWRNVTLGPEITGSLDTPAKERISRLLKEYGLADFTSAYPSQLSGGMRQRAALIRTLARKPDFLLLDEPFSALDYQTRLSVSNDIGIILRKSHATTILVTHDIAEAISMADRVIVLTPRPAQVQCILPIILTLTDRTPLNVRKTLEFKDYFNHIWEELNHNEKAKNSTREISI